MKRRPSKLLALTIGGKSLQLAEVICAAGKRSVGKVAEFPFPAGLSLATPKDLGEKLAAFCKAQKFTARDLVIGLPAKRLLTRLKQLPPANAVVAASTLRLQAETEFTGDADTFCIDYAGVPSTSASTNVLLFAASQTVIDQCTALAQAAGLKLIAVTSTSAALGQLTHTPGNSGDATDTLVVTVADGAAELLIQHGRGPTQLRHLATNTATPESLTTLANEIRRTVAALPRNGSPTPPKLTLALWNDQTNSTNTSTLQNRLGFPVSAPTLANFPLTATTTSNTFAPAIAIALSALDVPGLPIDFLHSRLAPPKVRSAHTPLRIAILAAILIIALVIWAADDLAKRQSALDSLRSQSKAHADQVAMAEAADNRLILARNWATGKPRTVLCLKELTALFPDEGSIWATNVTLTANASGVLGGVLTGRANGQPQIGALVSRMLTSKSFSNAKVIDLENASHSANAGSEKNFQISFSYHPAEDAK